MIEIPGKIPNKANRYEVHIAHSLWPQLKPIVEQWRKKNGRKAFWVGPSQEVKDYEKLVADLVGYKSKTHYPKNCPVDLVLHLYGQRIDVDGVKAVLDGIEQSGVIVDDKQIAGLGVLRMESTGEPCVKILLRRHVK